MVLDKGLVLCLPFSEGGGSKAYDRSKHQNHGTISGALAVGALEDGSGWLLDWDKRIKITIDHDDIDSDLTDFPIFIPLGTSVGIDSEDVSCVFDEVGANSLKIAVTNASGVTQCYVEIERWDNGNELAWLWVKVPSVSSSVDTILYLYYDNDHADNSTYVGAPNSVPAENVWDTDFTLVTHMQDDPDNAHVRDSTTSDNDGAKGAANEPIEAAGRIDKGQDFDGADDVIEILDNAGLNPTTAMTIEFWVKIGVYGTPDNLICKLGANQGYDVSTWNDEIVFRMGTGATYVQVVTTDLNLAVDTWYYIVAIWTGTVMKVYKNGVVSVDTINNALVATHAQILAIGSDNDGGVVAPFDGILDEVRFSKDIIRPDAYIKASYESGRDHLVTFGGELDRASALDWRFGRALYFDGVNDYVTISNDPSIDLDVSDFTIAFWVKLSELGVDSPLINKYGATAYQGWRVEVTPSNYIQVYAGDGIGASFDVTTSSSPVTIDDEWHHIVVVGDRDNKVQIYIDGIAVGTPDTTDIAVDINTAMPLQIGRWVWAGVYTNAIIDEIHIYKRALSSGEVRTLYEKTTH